VFSTTTETYHQPRVSTELAQYILGESNPTLNFLCDVLGDMSRSLLNRRAAISSLSVVLVGASGCLDSPAGTNDEGTEDENPNLTNERNENDESSFLIGMPVSDEEKEPVLSIEDDAPDFTVLHHVSQEVIETEGTVSRGIDEEEVDQFDELTTDVEYYEDASQPGYYMEFEDEVISLHTETEVEATG
ncbi:hypothetical protein QA600_17870, partial [Natronococcus sp. A-GB1]|uniref:hypothetical protein n=1 Tax=Natronococcus sp. A-GB1 TaxID=3037648 RepID=UPI00241C3940